MASTKFEVSMEIFKFQGEPDVSVTRQEPRRARHRAQNTRDHRQDHDAVQRRQRAGGGKERPQRAEAGSPGSFHGGQESPPQEAGKLAYARRRKGAHAPALPEMQERVYTVLARTANDQRVPEVRRENPAGRAGTVRVHLPGLQESELRPDERRGRRNRKREVLLRLRPEHSEAHVEPGQALLYDVRRAG